MVPNTSRARTSADASRGPERVGPQDPRALQPKYPLVPNDPLAVFIRAQTSTAITQGGTIRPA